MKPPAFEYVRVGTTEEAVAELARDGEDTKLLAGGQSLMPMLNMRLALPRRLIDLNRVGELEYIREREDGVAIGAMTRQRAVEKSALVARQVPLLADAMPWVGHFQIRNRGTIGGSPPHRHPAAALPPVAPPLDAPPTAPGPPGPPAPPTAHPFWPYLPPTPAPPEVPTRAWVSS